MKKQLSVLMLLAALLVPWAMRAQSTTPVSTFPYSCNFEDATENSEWVLVNGTYANKWVIDSAQNNTTGGSQGLYVSNNDGVSASYTKTTAQVVYAYREMELMPGEYNVSFDWKCYGESTYDYILAAVVPSSVTLTASGSLPSGVTNSAMTAAGWQNIGPRDQQYIKMNLNGSSWTTQSSFFTATDYGTYKLVFLWRNDGSSGTDPAACIDNISITEVACARPVGLTLKSLSYDRATLSWTQASGSSSYRLYVTTQPSFSLDSTAYTTVYDTLYEVTGLDSLTTYYWTVVSDCGSNGVSGVDAVKQFTTLRDCGAGYININQALTQGTSSNATCFAYQSTSYPIGHSACIFTQEEIMSLGLEAGADISAISLHAGATGCNSPLKIYIAETQMSEFSSSAGDTTGFHNLTLVFDDTLHSVAQEWVTLNFDSAFHYSGNGNLLLYFYRSATSSAAGTFYYTTSSPVYRSFYGYRSSTSTANPSYTRTYLRPDIKFDMCAEVPSCTRPTELTVSTAQTSATLQWTGCSSADSYLVTYSMSGLNAITVSTTSEGITIDNLVPGTTYDFSVRSICGTDTTFAESVTGTTACATLTTLPYTQTFEGAETGSTTSSTFVDCMGHLNNGTTYFGYPYVGTTSGYNHTPGGTKGLYWGLSTTTGTYGDYQVVVLPALDTDMIAMNTVQLRFWARATSTSYNPVFQVGVMTDPDSVESFQLVQTVTVGGNTEYSEFIVPFGPFEGYGQYVAIKAVRPTSAWYASMDDITLELMPNCPPIADLEASATVGSALLTWNYLQGYGEPVGYVVTYDSVGGSNPTVLNLSDPQTLLAGLEAGTEYKVYVQADCGDDYGPMDSIEFSTKAFDCVELDPATVDTVIFSNSTTGQSGCLAYSSYGNTAYQAVWTAAELTAAGLSAGTITGIDLGFTGCTTYNKEFTIFIGNTSTTSIASTTFEVPTQEMLVYGPANHPMNTSGWQHYDFTTPFNWDGVSSIIITTFMNQNGGSQTTSTGLTGYYVSAANRARYRYKDSSPFTLADVATTGTAASTYTYRAAIHFYTGDCMTEATCAAPTVTVSEVTASSATLTWAPGYNETLWDVDYRIKGTSEWTNAASAVSATTYTIDSLQAGTDYEFRISFTCSDDEGTLYSATATAFTPCLPVALPYSENFDGISTSTTATANYGVMPNCWDYVFTTTNSSYITGSYLPGVYYAAANASSGNYSLRLAGMGYFMLPEMPTTVDSLMISFNAYITSSSYGLQVGAMEDDGTFTPIDTLTIPVSIHSLFDINLNNYTGTSRRIALRNTYGTNNTYSYVYIDDIYVDYIPTCPHVTNLVVDSVTESSATLSWTAGGEEMEWSVSGSNGFFATTTTPGITVTGLAANSPYTFEVRALCGVDDSSRNWTIDVRTACEQYMALPYFENFDGYTTSTTAATGIHIPCWNELMTGSSTYQGASYQPQVYYSTSYPHSGDYCLRLYGMGYTSLQQLPVEANQVSMGFWARRTSTNYDLIVGIMSDPSDATTFDTIEQITFASTTATEYHEIDFSSYTGTGRYIAFRNVYGTNNTYSYIYLDDIEVWQNSSCATPTSLLASNISNNTATIGWVDTSSSYIGASLFWGTSPNRNYVTDSVTLANGVNSYNMTGLTSSTTYYVWMQGECTEEPSRAIMISFTTTPDCMPVENLAVSSIGNHGFALAWDAPTAGNAPTGYIVRYNETGYDSVFVDTVTTTYYYAGGLNASTNYTYSVSTICGNLVVEGDDNYLTTILCTEETTGDYATNFSALPVAPTQPFSYSQQIYLASELEGIDSISAIAFYNAGYAYNRRNVTVYLGNTSKDMFTSGSDFVPFSNLTQVYSGPYEGFDWYTMHFSQTFVRDADSNLVVVVDDNTGTSQSNNAYFASSNLGDSTRAIYTYGSANINPSSPSAGTASGYRNHVIFTPADCMQPTCDVPVVVVTATTTTSVSVQWPVETGIAYAVDYRPRGADNWTVVETANTTGTSVINTLTPSAEWEIRVSFSCNGMMVYGTAMANTQCGAAALPLAEDFESREFGGYVRPCWLVGQTRFNGTDAYPRVTRLTGSEDRLLFLYGGAYLVMPKVNVPLNELQLSFKLTQGGTGARLLLGVIADQSLPITSMIVLDTLVRSDIDATTSTVNVAYSFEHIDTAYNNYHVAFYDAFSDNYSFLNDIYLDYIPACTPPDSIEVSAITTTTATLTWDGNGENATSYYVVYGPRGFSPNSGDGDTVAVNVPTATVAGLTHSTDYDAYVFTVCSAVGAQSTASQVIQFTTDCDAVSQLPYTMDFDHVLPPGNTSADMMPNCWLSEVVSGSDRPRVYYTTTTNYTGSGNYCLYFSGMGVAALPEMAAPLNTLAVSFREYNPTPAAYTMVVGTVGDTANGLASAFVPYDTLVYDVNTNTYNHTVYFSDYTGTATRIAIRNTAVSGTTSTHYLDDVVVNVAPACIPPQHIRTTHLVSNEATLVWNRSNASTYTVIYGVHGSATTSTDFASTRSITLSGLTPQTRYDVKIVGDCSADTVLYTFTTPCNDVSLPYTENFDSYTTSTTAATGVQVDCWGFLPTGTATYQTGSYVPQIYYSTTNANSGNYSYRLYGRGYHTLPPMPTSLDSLQIVFNHYSSSASYLLEVGVMEGDVFIPVQAITPTASTHTEYTVNFSSYQGDSRIIAFHNYYTSATIYYSYHYIDDIEVDYIPTCPKVVNLQYTDATDNSVTLAWNTTGSESDWMISFNNTDTLVSDSVATIYGLLPDSSYTFAVRPVCGADDTGRARYVTAGTTCSPVTLPYQENFDNITTSTSTTNYGSVPDCWRYVMTGTATYQTGSYLPRVYYSSTYSNSGSYCYYMYGVGYHILPPMPTSLDSLELTFSRYFSSASYGLEVGVMEGNTFVPVETITGTTSTHTDHTVYFGTYTGTSRVIAFRNYYTTSATTYYSGNYIDDIDVHYLPSCPRVLDVHASASSTTSLSVDWTDQTAATMWEVEYGAMGHTLGTGTTVTVNSHPYTISGLTELTNYDVYVRPICSATDTGAWSLRATLMTSMCDNATEFFTGASTGTQNQGPVNNFYRHTLSQTIIDSAELAGLGEISYIAYSYAYSSATTAKTNVNIWFQPTSKSQFSSNTDAVAVNPATAVKVYHGALNCSQGWNIFQLDTSYTWDGHSNLLVIVQDNSGAYDGSAYVFDITSHSDYKFLTYYRDGTAGVDTISAYNPSTFTASTAYRYQRRPTMKLISCGAGNCEVPTLDSILLDETAITIAVSTGDSASATVEAVITDQPWSDSLAATLTPATLNYPAVSTHTFNGLTENTGYTVAVRRRCGGSYSDWATLPVTTLRHPCAVPTAVTVSDETFDGATVSWTPGEAETDWEVKVFCASPVYEHTYTVNGTPSVEVTGLDDGVTYSVTVRAVCDPTWMSPWSDTVALTTVTCEQVSGVSSSNVTASSATISWTSTGVESYMIEYGVHTLTQGSGTTVTSATNSVELTGLEEQTTYDVYVRGVCAEGVTSVWSSIHSFTTTAVGIDDVESGSVTLYPNPASERVTIRGIEGESTVTVVDLNGREVYKTNTGSDLTIDVSGYAKGAYFVRITGERTTAIRKLIVK